MRCTRPVLKTKYPHMNSCYKSIIRLKSFILYFSSASHITSHDLYFHYPHMRWQNALCPCSHYGPKLCDAYKWCHISLSHEKSYLSSCSTNELLLFLYPQCLVVVPGNRWAQSELDCLCKSSQRQTPTWGTWPSLEHWNGEKCTPTPSQLLTTDM